MKFTCPTVAKTVIVLYKGKCLFAIAFQPIQHANAEQRKEAMKHKWNRMTKATPRIIFAIEIIHIMEYHRMWQQLRSRTIRDLALCERFAFLFHNLRIDHFWPATEQPLLVCIWIGVCVCVCYFQFGLWREFKKKTQKKSHLWVVFVWLMFAQKIPFTIEIKTKKRKEIRK